MVEGSLTVELLFFTPPPSLSLLTWVEITQPDNQTRRAGKLCNTQTQRLRAVGGALVECSPTVELLRFLTSLSLSLFDVASHNNLTTRHAERNSIVIHKRRGGGQELLRHTHTHTHAHTLEVIVSSTSRLSPQPTTRRSHVNHIPLCILATTTTTKPSMSHRLASFIYSSFYLCNSAVQDSAISENVSDGLGVKGKQVTASYFLRGRTGSMPKGGL